MTNDQEAIYKGSIEELKGQLATANLRIDVASKIMDRQDTLIRNLQRDATSWMVCAGVASGVLVAAVVSTLV